MAFCRRLLKFRKDYPVLLDGSIEFINSPQDILAFVRSNDDESVLCVFNLGKTQQQWTPEVDGTDIQHDPVFEIGDFRLSKSFLLPSLAGYIKQLVR